MKKLGSPSLESIKRLTLEEIEAQRGLKKVEDVEDGWPLEMWYQSIRRKSLGELNVGDVSKACRQQVFPEQIVPLAVEMLKTDPLAGELYEGELLAALKSVPIEHWEAHPEQVKAVRVSIEALAGEPDADTQGDCRELLKRFDSIEQ